MTKEQKESTSALHEKLKLDENDVALEEKKLLEHPSYLELQRKLEEAEEKANQNWDRVLRIQAEKDNLSRRVERDIENAHKYGLEKFTMELLPIVDGLERAVSTLADEHSKELEGIILTLKMFSSAFGKFGIQQVDPMGQPFNPEQHQAVSTEANSDVVPNTVINVLQKGYLLNNRLVRPALVVVSKSN